ncbi:hypothetical protein UFOVP887_43 [uncultured Caudovirales phage]|uniref:Uncharacterized protein n=3 Tax=uncultured Caudovirales phage TaxID=2100421 RepID=A0A6J5PIV6_9CAUD|nr:hypothetical protein UFOVP887_43 [uncultured Caudovirales phage]
MSKSILKNELNSGNFSKWELICLFNTIIDDQKSYIIASDEILDKLVEDLNNDIITHDEAVGSIIDLVDDSRFDEFYENVIDICRIADEEFNDYHLTKTVSTFSIQAGEAASL